MATITRIATNNPIVFNSALKAFNKDNERKDKI